MPIRNTVTPSRYINQDILAQRISEAAEWDKQERLEEERKTIEKVRGHSDRETKLYQRINRASEDDTAGKRFNAQQLEARIEQEKQKQVELLRENEQLRTLKEEQEYY